MYGILDNPNETPVIAHGPEAAHGAAARGIMKAIDDSDMPLLWVVGAPGSGKTTLAWSLCRLHMHFSRVAFMEGHQLKPHTLRRVDSHAQIYFIDEPFNAHGFDDPDFFHREGCLIRLAMRQTITYRKGKVVAFSTSLPPAYLERDAKVHFLPSWRGTQ